MKTKLFLLFFTSSLCSFCFGQLQYGAKLGFTESWTTTDGSNDLWNTKPRAGFTAGGFLDVPVIKNLKLRTGLQLTQKGMISEIDNMNSPVYFKKTWALYYLEVPVDIVYRFPLSKSLQLFVGTGIVPGYGLFGNEHAIAKATDQNGQSTTTERHDGNIFQDPNRK